MVLAVIAVAIAYLPVFGPTIDIASDGQFAQFFESGWSWSDLYAGGWPRYADPNSMAFYPLKFLFPATREGFDYFVLSAAFLFALGNGALALSETRSLAGAALATLVSPAIGFFVAHSAHTSMLHTAAYAPWLILGCVRLSRDEPDRRRWFVLLMCATALSTLAGHMQITVFSLLAGALYVLPDSRQPRVWARVYAIAGLAVLLGLGLCAPALLTSTGYLAETARSASSSTGLAQYSLRPFELGLAALPYLAGGDWANMVRLPFLGTDASHTWDESVAYLGMALPLLVVAGLLTSRASFSQKKFLWIGLACLLLALAPSVGPAADFLARLPVVSLFRSYSRWQLLSTISAIQLAAWAVAGLQAGRWRLSMPGRVFLLAAPIVLAVAVVLAFNAWGGASGKIGFDSLIRGQAAWQIAIALLLAAVLAGAPWYQERGKWVLGLALGVAILLPPLELGLLTASSTLINAHAGAGRLAELRGERIAKVKAKLRANGGRLLTMSGWGSRDLAPDMARAAGIPALNWYGPFLNVRFSQLTGMTSGGWINPAVVGSENQVLDIYGVSAVEEFAPDTDPRSVLTRQSLADPSRWTRLAGDEFVPVYINHRALPRLRVMGNSVQLDDAQALAALTTSVGPDGRHFSAQSSAIVDSSELLMQSTHPSVGYAVRAEPNQGRFQVSFAKPTVEPSLLILADNFSPYWKSTVDGRKVATHRVNYNQVGVLVPAGARTVGLRYRDLTLLRGLAISLLCLLLAIAFVLATRPRHHGAPTR